MTMFSVTSKTDNYTLVAGDTDRELQFDKATAVTATLPAASTAGNGFSVMLRNMGAGDLTISPDGAETIDGESSLVLMQNHWCWLGSNGSVFRIIQRFVDEFEYMQPVTKTGDYTVSLRDAGKLLMLDSETDKTFSLPNVSSTSWVRGNVYGFKTIDDGVLTLDPNGTDTIDGNAGMTLENGNGVVLIGDGSDDTWRSLSVAGEMTGIGNNNSFYDDIVALDLDSDDLKLVLDAGSSASYTSGEKWIDLKGNNAGEFMLGSETSSSTTGDEPAFQGTAGDLSSSEYFSFDGGDFLKYDATNEAWMKNMHLLNAKFTIAMWVYKTDNAADQSLCGTVGNLGVGWEYSIGRATLNTQHLTVRGASGTETLVVHGDATLANDQWHFIALSIDGPAGAGGSFFYHSGTYDQESSSNTFDGGYDGNHSSSSAHATMEIGAMGAGSHKIPNNSRIAGLMIWEGTALSKTNLDNIWKRQRGRFGL